MIGNPYLLFCGDAPDGLAAKVRQGIQDWRPQKRGPVSACSGCQGRTCACPT